MQASRKSGGGGWLLGAAGVVATAWLLGRRHRNAFVGKLAVVTGGSRGLGFQIARELGRRGATVVICARDEAELERAAQKLGRAGIDAYHRVCDVRDRERVAKTIAAIEREHGAIDVLVNNAGILHIGPATAMTVDDLHAAMDTNFWGAVHTVDAALPGMLARHRGQIVNIASIGGIAPVPWMLPYSASKAAIFGWSVGLHHDLRGEGIDVTTVAPWVMRTGGPINCTFKGSSRRGAFTALALADITPGLAVDARAAAKTIVAAAARKQALVRVGLASKLLASVFQLAPGVVSGMFAGIAGLLPRSFTHAGDSGQQLARELGPLGRRIAERSRGRNNQPAIEPADATPTMQAPTAEDVARAQVAAGVAE